jgi:predicted RNA-binding Zn-ribbon protein involved in translation (DUF1610 family)
MKTNLPFTPEGRQYCFACMKEVEFPHQCPNIFGKAATHDFKPCHEHQWHTPAQWVECSQCGWHIEVASVKDVAICPKSMNFDIYKDVWPGTVSETGSMPCPKCGTDMKKLFSSRDKSVSRYVCTKCHPLSP